MMTQLHQRMLKEFQRHNYATGTIRLYLRPVAAFAQHFHRSLDQLGAEEIRRYQLFLILLWPAFMGWPSTLGLGIVTPPSATQL